MGHTLLLVKFVLLFKIKRKMGNRPVMPLMTRNKTGTSRDKTGTSRDKTGTSRDKTGTEGAKQGQ